MAQDPRQQQFAQMLGAMPPNALQAMKKELQKRFALFGVGLAIVIVGAFLNLTPVYLPTLIMLAGGAVAVIGLLGLSRGTGCMAYVAGFFWLSAVTCGVARGNEVILYVLGGAAAAFALAALFIPKPKAVNPMAEMMKMMQQQGGMGGPGGPFPQAPNNAIGGQRPARERVIDVDATEKKSESKPKK